MATTFLSVRLATRKYYYSIRKGNARQIMEQGLLLMLKQETIPPDAKSILVKNKGMAVFRWKKYECKHPFEFLRKTIDTVGGDEGSTSKARTRFWGVLGLAYRLNRPVVYDFETHNIYEYKVGITKKTAVKRSDGKYYYPDDIEGKNRNCYLSDENTDRSIMFAIPLRYRGKLVGGVTFDVDSAIDEKEELKETLFGKDTTTTLIDMCKKLSELGPRIVDEYFHER